jgi:hypothetical protein
MATADSVVHRSWRWRAYVVGAVVVAALASAVASGVQAARGESGTGGLLLAVILAGLALIGLAAVLNGQAFYAWGPFVYDRTYASVQAATANDAFAFPRASTVLLFAGLVCFAGGIIAAFLIA